MQHVNELYRDAKGGIHYVIPIRGGRICSDIMFEEEFEKVVQETCEIHEGKIRLKDGAKQCQIIRQQI